METKSAHIDNETHRSHQHAANSKTWNSTMSHRGLQQSQHTDELLVSAKPDLEDKIPLSRKFLNPREQTVLLKGPKLNHFTCLYFPSPTPVEQPCTINRPVSWIDPSAKFQCEAQAVKALLCLPHVENRRNTRWALRVWNKTPVGGCPLWHHRGVISKTLCFRAPSEKWSN